MKENWIYQIRGLAIIAVVVCHQQWLLHDSEIIQMFTLYSVTTLIFLMGVTKAISLKGHYAVNNESSGILVYSFKSMLPLLCAYTVATFVYSSYKQEIDFNRTWSDLLGFSAFGPAYFIRHYILLSLYAPFLYAVIKYILCKDTQKYYKIIIFALFFTLVWIIGYGSIGRLDVVGQSYLFVYSVGLLFGQIKINKIKIIYFIPAMTVLLCGLISVKRFYFARVAGVFDYSGGINFFAPKLQMNPPNISVILYSAGVIWTAYLFFEMFNKGELRYGKILGQPFAILGKYSMDIFLWHMFIRQCLNVYFAGMNQGVCKCFIYYFSMFFIPVFVRYTYTRVKIKMNEVLKCE